ncbi:MAG: nitrogenase component 1 [Elusimicrobiales bacterium]|nr:nitrogenase component 1 [Elusimicrobiales bacterium]
MKDTRPAKVFDKSYSMPYLMGYFLAANAVKDLCAVVDGANCVMQKVDLLEGNHDLFCTLLSPDGRHRAVCTMVNPLNPDKNPEKKLSALLKSLAAHGGYGAVTVASLPFCRMAGMDYGGIAAAVEAKAPVAALPPMPSESDWLDGYADTLETLARALPLTGRKGKLKAAVVGYMFDRNEFDHVGNLKELRRLLALAGLELVCVWPEGSSCAALSRAGEAGLIISLPYGRKAARTLAARTGAKLLETGLPLGLAGTSAWLAAVRKAAGLKGPLPAALAAEEVAAADLLRPALRLLQNRSLVFCGDPYLYGALAAFAGELCSEVSAAFFNCGPRPLGPAPKPGALLFAPAPDEAAAALLSLGRYRRPGLAVADSFAWQQGLAGGAPLVELGFPSYAHHCLADEPFLGYAGALRLAGRMLNALQGHRG